MSVVAERIARAHNSFRNARLLVFSPAAMSVEPLEDPDGFGLDLERLPFPVADHDVTVEEVEQWLRNYRRFQSRAIEVRRKAQEEARARNAIRVGERHARAGGGAVQCPGCKRFKSRPSDPCPNCPATVGSNGADPRDVDRAWGVG